MDSFTVLDYALFQLTPTRTRCDLVLSHGGKTEKLASGLFEPFVTHLTFVKDQISKSGYSIKLCPPAKIAPWFSKGTFERFVLFVNTPAVLERFVSLEREILQIESSVQANELTGQAEEGGATLYANNTRSSSDYSKNKGQLGRNDCAVPRENSKIQLQRLLENRKALLRKEQAMAYARGLVAGFDMDKISDLISFADSFGASRLRDACINFKELCKKKHGDGLWIQELAAVEACLPSDLTFSGSGIALANEINTTDGSPETSDQIPSATAKVQAPKPWPNQIPQYMYGVPTHTPHWPPFQGYPFPIVQPIPPYDPKDMHWPATNKEYHAGRKGKLTNRKESEDSGEEKQIQSCESEVNNNSESYLNGEEKSSTVAPYSKKHGKKSSKTVVIRNINYITSRRSAEKNGIADESSSSEDELIDENYLKQKVDDAVGSMEKLHKSRNKKRDSPNSNNIINSLDATHVHDFSGSPVSYASREGKTCENWNAFESLSMRDEKTVDSQANILHSMDSQDENLIIRSSADGSLLGSNNTMDLASEIPKVRVAACDSFILSSNDGRDEDKVRRDDFETEEYPRPIVKHRDSLDEDLVLSGRLEERGTAIEEIQSYLATETSIMKPVMEEDWFVTDRSGKLEHQGLTNELAIFGGAHSLSILGGIKKSIKDPLIDDSFMVHSRPATDEIYDSQWKTDINMAADLILSSQTDNGLIHVNNVQNVDEPNDLCVVLDRGSRLESSRESWTRDPGIDVSFLEADVPKSNVESSKLALNGDITSVNKGETKGRKLTTREARSKSLPGSSGKRKTEGVSKSKKPSLTSRHTTQKSKLEKEEEIRKKMEELLIERQRRIAERTAAGGFSPVTTKKFPAPAESKTGKGSIKVDKSKTHSSARETNKLNSARVKAI